MAKHTESGNRGNPFSTHRQQQPLKTNGMTIDHIRSDGIETEDDLLIVVDEIYKKI